MPYDPSLPGDASRAVAAQMRGQFAGLKELIDAVSGVTSAEVDGVTPLNPGEPATATVSVTGSVLPLALAFRAGMMAGRASRVCRGRRSPAGPWMA